MKRIYVCSDTVTGLFSAIYEAWKCVIGGERKECGIRLRGHLEQELFCEYTEVEETERKAEAVERLLEKHLGDYAREMIYRSALSVDAGKGDAILYTMLEARKIPDSRKIMDHLSCPSVEKVFELSRTVGNEIHFWHELLRFQELQNGVLFAKFRPKNRVITCVTPHFAERLSVENFMIYDETYGEYAVHEAGKQWILVSGKAVEKEKLLRFSEKEDEIQELWKEFFQAIAIEERTNPKCQRTHLPLWYRKNMTEFILGEEVSVRN